MNVSYSCKHCSKYHQHLCSVGKQEEYVGKGITLMVTVTSEVQICLLLPDVLNLMFNAY